MIITNKLGLPEPFVDMAKSDYIQKPNRYSVTSLLKGVREVLLERRHSGETEQDVSDMIWALFGQAVHGILENSKESEHQFKEIKLEEEVAGRVLSGRFDLYDSKTETIDDYKVTSVWKLIVGDDSDWKRQLSIYAYLLEAAGFPVKRGRIIAILKDHNKRDAKYKPEYPKFPVQIKTYEFNESDKLETKKWIEDRIESLKYHENISDNELPICTLQERFNSGDSFAVMKNGRKTALRVLSTLQDAEEWLKSNKGDYIETRKGEDKKCRDYCRVAPFCNYYLETYGNKGDEENGNSYAD